MAHPGKGHYAVPIGAPPPPWTLAQSTINLAPAPNMPAIPPLPDRPPPNWQHGGHSDAIGAGGCLLGWGTGHGRRGQGRVYNDTCQPSDNSHNAHKKAAVAALAEEQVRPWILQVLSAVAAVPQLVVAPCTSACAQGWLQLGAQPPPAGVLAQHQSKRSRVLFLVSNPDIEHGTETRIADHPSHYGQLWIDNIAAHGIRCANHTHWHTQQLGGVKGQRQAAIDTIKLAHGCEWAGGCAAGVLPASALVEHHPPAAFPNHPGKWDNIIQGRGAYGGFTALQVTTECNNQIAAGVQILCWCHHKFAHDFTR